MLGFTHSSLQLNYAGKPGERREKVDLPCRVPGRAGRRPVSQAGGHQADPGGHGHGAHLAAVPGYDPADAGVRRDVALLYAQVGDLHVTLAGRRGLSAREFVRCEAALARLGQPRQSGAAKG